MSIIGSGLGGVGGLIVLALASILAIMGWVSLVFGNLISGIIFILLAAFVFGAGGAFARKLTGTT